MLTPVTYAQFTVSHIARLDDNPANIDFNHAEKLAFQAQHDSAITIYRKAKVEFENLKDWVGIADCYNRIGDNYKEKAIYDSSLYYSGSALEIALNKLGNQNSALIRIYNSIGFVYWNAAEYDSSFDYFSKALAIPHDDNDPDIAQTYFCFALYYRVRGNYDTALDYHNKALTIRLKSLGTDHIDVAHSYHAIGLVYNRKEDYDQALEYLKKALQIKQAILIPNHPNLAHTFNSLGNIYLMKNDGNLGLKYLNQALAIWIEAYGEFHPDVAMIYNNFGIIYSYQGDYDRSIEYHKKAFEIQLKLFGENFVGHVNTYKLIGFAYQTKGDYRKAIDNYSKALLLSINHYGSVNSNTVDCYKYFGSIYLDMGNYGKSIEYWNKFLDVTLKMSGDISPDIGYAYRCLGRVYVMKGEYKKAQELYQKALSIYSQIYFKTNFRIGEISNDIGEAYFMQDQYFTALKWIQKGIISSVVDFGDTNIYSNPPLDHSYDETELLISLKLRAECFEKIYSMESHDHKDLQMALVNYEMAAEVINKMRQGHKTESSKLSRGVETIRIYERAIKIALDLYNQTQNANYKQKAFTFAERSKSAILLEAMSDLQAKVFVSIPDSLLEKERNLKVDLAFYETQLLKEKTEQNDSAKIQKLEDKLFLLKFNYESFVRNLEMNYPEYHRLKYNTVSASVEDIQHKQLDSNQVLLEYFLGENSLVIYTISSNHFEIRSFIKDSALESSVMALRKSLFNLNTDGYADKASKLYQWLIEPAAEDIKSHKKLIIVPDGILNYLPFEALLTKKVPADNFPDFTKLHYLINDYQISYYYSSTLLMHQQIRPEMSSSFLGIAPVFSDSDLSDNNLIATSGRDNYMSLSNSLIVDGKTFSSLPYTESELKSIDSLFRRHNLTTRMYLHDVATEKTIKSAETKRYKFIHIASHGFINETNPKLSGIVFSKADSTEDGILYAGEIYNLPLKADLVVLSACESGLGKIVRGEGIMSLTRGFIYSGAKNVIVSLWQVRDRSASVLMKHVYEYILNGQSNSEALQQAKLKLISNPKYAYPLDWSSFILIGQ